MAVELPRQAALRARDCWLLKMHGKDRRCGAKAPTPLELMELHHLGFLQPSKQPLLIWDQATCVEAACQRQVHPLFLTPL